MIYNLINYCEFDRYASKAYSLIHNTSEDLNLGDITKVNEKQISDFDFMTWGFCCQDISVAGKQKGFIDEEGNKTRSGLYYDGLRILRHKQPKFSIIENVKALTGQKFQKEFQQILIDLDESGYNNYYKVLNAKNYGIPQNRERVFIISIRKDIDNGDFKFPEKIPLNVKVEDFLENDVDEKYYLKKNLIDTFVQKTKDLKDDKVYNDFLIQVGILDMKGNDCIRRVYSPKGLCPTITTMGGGNTEPKFICEKRYDKGFRFFKDNMCGTIRTIDSGGDKVVFENINNELVVRKITPRECWRLMGFQDSDFDLAERNGMSNAQLYKQAGNSIVVDVLVEIYKELKNAFPNDFCDGIRISTFFSGIGAFEAGFRGL